jgi:hypothetical protein
MEDALEEEDLTGGAGGALAPPRPPLARVELLAARVEAPRALLRAVLALAGAEAALAAGVVAAAVLAEAPAGARAGTEAGTGAGAAAGLGAAVGLAAGAAVADGVPAAVELVVAAGAAPLPWLAGAAPVAGLPALLAEELLAVALLREVGRAMGGRNEGPGGEVWGVWLSRPAPRNR